MKSDFLLYLLQASGCMAVLYLLYRLLLHRETFFSFNRWYILGGLGLSLLLPLIELPDSPTPLYVMPAIHLDPIAAVGGETQKSFDWKGLLVELYEVGVFIFAARLLYRLYHIRNLARQLPGETRKDYVLLRTGGSLPTFSFLKWLFWDETSQLTEYEQNQILRHEEAHIRQRHSVDVLLLEITGAIFWFNPFIYLFSREIKAVHEYLADREAVQHEALAAYARLMSNQILQKYNLSLAQPFNQFQIKNRLSMLGLSQTTRPALWKTALSISLVVLLSVVYACRSSEVLEPKGLGTEAGKEGTGVVGTVSFSEDGSRKPLPGAIVVVEGTTIGATADENGSFRLNQVPAGSTLAFSHVGFATRLIPVDPAGKALTGLVAHDVQLTPAITALSLEERKPALSAAPPASEGPVFMVVEKMPEYKGGIEALVSYFNQKLLYPKEAREKKLTGTVFVSFIVNADGTVSNAQVLKGIGSGCDEEALRVVQNMPDWTPGMQSGRPVSVRYSLPVKFAL